MNRGDCGMFCVKAAEFMIHGIPVSSLHQDNISMYRKKMATELYKHGALKMANNVESDEEN